MGKTQTGEELSGRESKEGEEEEEGKRPHQSGGGGGGKKGGGRGKKGSGGEGQSFLFGGKRERLIQY